jgi:hypothetical protein
VIHPCPHADDHLLMSSCACGYHPGADALRGTLERLADHLEDLGDKNDHAAFIASEAGNAEQEQYRLGRALSYFQAARMIRESAAAS